MNDNLDEKGIQNTLCLLGLTKVISLDRPQNWNAFPEARIDDRSRRSHAPCTNFSQRKIRLLGTSFYYYSFNKNTKTWI